jgi:hypothetical protein
MADPGAARLSARSRAARSEAAVPRTGRFPVGQQVDRSATVQVDHHDAVAVAAAHREVIHLSRRQDKWIYPELGIIPRWPVRGSEVWVVPWFWRSRGVCRSG